MGHSHNPVLAPVVVVPPSGMGYDAMGGQPDVQQSYDFHTLKLRLEVAERRAKRAVCTSIVIGLLAIVLSVAVGVVLGMGSEAPDLTDLNDRVSDMEDTLSTQASDMSSLTSTVSTQGTTLSTLGGDVTALSSTVSVHTTSLSTLTSDMSTLSGSVSTQGTSLSTLDGDVAALSSTVSGHTTSLVTLSDNVSDVESDVATLSSTVADHTTSLSTLGSSLSELASTVATHGTDISGIDTELTSLEGSLSSQAGSLSSLSSRVSSVESAVSGNADSISSLETVSTSHTSSLGTLDTSVTAHEDEITDLALYTDPNAEEADVQALLMDGVVIVAPIYTKTTAADAAASLERVSLGFTGVTVRETVADDIARIRLSSVYRAGDNTDDYGCEYLLTHQDLSPAGAWIPGNQVVGQYVMAMYDNPTAVVAVATRGRVGSSSWVSSYAIEYYDSLTMSWMSMESTMTSFDGNTSGGSGVVLHVFSTPVVTRRVRVTPLAWTDLIAMGLEVYGWQ
ncbi:hypothetical protein KIPB_003107 [Kipferlia bialata]|uniref:F5/8 type C domain-containing protein n=1 Tax=Kipferlia bialata TaxID=797122 RepID=A0A9K3GGX9_9EUKA|nr:hypothetical protein KIPB_003107 [Kipferlia bialata]|eukprot:g3107.t1